MKKVVTFLVGLIARLSAFAGAVAIFMLGVSYFAAVSSQSKTQKAPPKQVSVATALVQSSYAIKRRFAGRLNATQVSDLGFELGGEIISVTVEEGDLVEKGQLLARLDTAQLDRQREQLQAQVREVEAQLARARASFDRIADLVPDAATPQQLDDIRAERDGLAARRDQIHAAIASLDVQKRDAELVAPYSGEITLQYEDTGAVVGAGQRILRINGGGPLEAEIGIPVRFRDQIELGRSYQLTAGSLTGNAIARQIVNDIKLSTQTVTILFTVEQDPGFVPSDLVRVTLQDTLRADGIWVPAGALTESVRGLWAVYVVEPQPTPVESQVGKVVRKDIEIIHLEETRAFVRGTLEEGDLVILSSPFRFVPGQEVKYSVTVGGINTAAAAPQSDIMP